MLKSQPSLADGWVFVEEYINGTLQNIRLVWIVPKRMWSVAELFYETNHEAKGQFADEYISVPMQSSSLHKLLEPQDGDFSLTWLTFSHEENNNIRG